MRIMGISGLVSVLLLLYCTQPTEGGKDHFAAHQERMKNWWNNLMLKKHQFWNNAFNKGSHKGGAVIWQGTVPGVPAKSYMPHSKGPSPSVHKGQKGFFHVNFDGKHQQPVFTPGRIKSFPTKSFNIKSHFEKLFNKGNKGVKGTPVIHNNQWLIQGNSKKGFDIKGHFDKFFNKGDKGTQNTRTVHTGVWWNQQTGDRRSGLKGNYDKSFNKGGMHIKGHTNNFFAKGDKGVQNTRIVNAGAWSYQPLGNHKSDSKGHYDKFFNKGDKGTQHRSEVNIYESPNAHQQIISKTHFEKLDGGHSFSVNGGSKEQNKGHFEVSVINSHANPEYQQVYHYQVGPSIDHGNIVSSVDSVQPDSQFISQPQDVIQEQQFLPPIVETHVIHEGHILPPTGDIHVFQDGHIVPPTGDTHVFQEGHSLNPAINSHIIQEGQILPPTGDTHVFQEGHILPLEVDPHIIHEGQIISPIVDTHVIQDHILPPAVNPSISQDGQIPPFIGDNHIFQEGHILPPAINPSITQDGHFFSPTGTNTEIIQENSLFQPTSHVVNYESQNLPWFEISTN